MSETPTLYQRFGPVRSPNAEDIGLQLPRQTRIVSDPDELPAPSQLTFVPDRNAGSTTEWLTADITDVIPTEECR